MIEVTRASRRSARKPRRRFSFVGLIGEIFLTAGVVVLLYTAWTLWIGDAIQGAQNNEAGSQLSEQWATTAPTAPAPQESATEDPTVEPPAPITADPVKMDQPAEGQQFGVMWIPRLGPDYSVPIAGGVNPATSLNVGDIGHYPGTAMPGDQGNFAVAAHRGSHGAPFMNLPNLHEGDAVVIETQDGWYTYRYRNSEYVTPQSVDVLLPIPRVQGSQPSGRYITMTTCSPRYGSAERLIAYGVFESFTPRSAGAPASLTEVSA